MDNMSYLIGAVAIGVGATLVMDVWAVVLRRVFNVPSLNFCLVGRWLLHMPFGTFRHEHIAKAAEKSGECVAGWMVHYLTGIAFAFILVLPSAGAWMDRPTLMPALAVGIGTVLLPFLIMQPAFGFGIAAAGTPNPARARLKSVMTHAVFGAGLYLSALPVSLVLAGEI